MPEDAEERWGAEVAVHHCPLRNGNGMAQVARQQPALLDQLRAHLEDAQRRVEDQEDQKHLDEAVSERTQLKLEHRPEATVLPSPLSPHFTACAADFSSLSIRKKPLAGPPCRPDGRQGSGFDSPWRHGGGGAWFLRRWKYKLFVPRASRLRR